MFGDELEFWMYFFFLLVVTQKPVKSLVICLLKYRIQKSVLILLYKVLQESNKNDLNKKATDI